MTMALWTRGGDQVTDSPGSPSCHNEEKGFRKLCHMASLIRLQEGGERQYGGEASDGGVAGVHDFEKSVAAVGRLGS